MKTRTVGFSFPNPEVAVPGGPPKSTEQTYEFAKQFMAKYLRAFIDGFLEMNGLRENLFNEKEILRAAYSRIESTPIGELTSPEGVRQGIITFRTDLMNTANRLYRKDMPNQKYFVGGGRVDALERKVNGLLLIEKQNAEIIKELEELKQRLNRVQQKQPTATAAPIIPMSGPHMRISYLALLLAGVSLVVQLFFRGNKN